MVNDIGRDHRVRNVLKLQSHSTVPPFTFFFLLFSPFLHNLLSAHSSSSSKSRSSLLKILYRQSGLLIFFFDFRLFMCLSLQVAMLRVETKVIRKKELSVSKNIRCSILVIRFIITRFCSRYVILYQDHNSYSLKSSLR